MAKLIIAFLMLIFVILAVLLFFIILLSLSLLIFSKKAKAFSKHKTSDKQIG